ncbi:accessory Sec system protein Asp2 [Streptococcus sp. 2A/TPW/M5]
MEEEEISKFKALILEKPEDLLALGEDLAYFQPYTVFYDKSYELEAPSEELAHLLRLKQARPWDFSNKHQFLYVLDRFLYDNQYGDAFTVRDLRVRPDFAGQQTVLGQHFLKLDGSYGEEFTPIAQWVYNYVYDASRPINFWLEYEKIQAVSYNCGFNFTALVHWESGSKMQSFQKKRWSNH